MSQKTASSCVFFCPCVGTDGCRFVSRGVDVPSSVDGQNLLVILSLSSVEVKGGARAFHGDLLDAVSSSLSTGHQQDFPRSCPPLGGYPSPFQLRGNHARITKSTIFKRCSHEGTCLRNSTGAMSFSFPPPLFVTLRVGSHLFRCHRPQWDRGRCPPETWAPGLRAVDRTSAEKPARSAAPPTLVRSRAGGERERTG